MLKLGTIPICRKVAGYAVYPVYQEPDETDIVGYDLVGPNGLVQSFSVDGLGLALEAYYSYTNVRYWFAEGYQLYPVFANDQSDEILQYEITDPNGQIIKSSGPPDGLIEVASKFQELTGVDIFSLDEEKSDPDRNGM